MHFMQIKESENRKQKKHLPDQIITIMIEAGAFYFCFYFSILDIFAQDIFSQEDSMRAAPVSLAAVFQTEFFQKPPFILPWPPPICPPISPPIPP